LPSCSRRFQPAWPDERSFYEIESISVGWSVPEPKRKLLDFFCGPQIHWELPQNASFQKTSL
jgi:hypothetical protein